MTRKEKLVSMRKATKKCADAKRLLIQAVKERPCHDCKVVYPYWIMDFDHVRGKKDFNLGIGANRSIHRLLLEIEKCDIVCANCHRSRTFNRRKSK